MGNKICKGASFREAAVIGQPGLSQRFAQLGRALTSQALSLTAATSWLKRSCAPDAGLRTRLRALHGNR
ncbi:hypothetical protein Pth03_09740 [Planotetraspora thailandica]|uniref:Uncharacterized protein n=1 Tax=Planotetraspora thailandica TaxID=487172 RepID=A0A8J3UXS9_9ACTN|nr:hypothetical protein Pth03_09740 [Planotetraspora thailandica]